MHAAYKIEPRREKPCFLLYANNKGADKPAHPHSLIDVFVVRCLDSIIYILAISKISRLWLSSVAGQAGLCLTLSQTPKTWFLVMGLNCIAPGRPINSQERLMLIEAHLKSYKGIV